MSTTENSIEQAVKNLEFDAATRLLDGGADPNRIIDDQGSRLLHRALSAESPTMMKLLVEKGAEPKIYTATGDTLLHSAAFCGYPDEAAAYLLDLQLDPNFRNAYGWTPLHRAVYQNRLSYIKLLMEKGANPHIPTSKGETAFTMAEEVKNQEILEVLESFKDKYQIPEPGSLSIFKPADEGGENKSESIDRQGADETGYLIDQDLTGDREKETRIRKILTEWADTIPHHGIDDIGEQIKVDQINYRPAYLLTLSSLYDNRYVSTHSVPYTDQELPERKFKNPSEVDVWDFTLSLPDNFESIHDRYTVAGSQYVETCHHCSGHGSISCPSCRGAGKDTCHSCGGRGESTCSSCHGRKKQSCTYCGGRGEIGEVKTFNRTDSRGVDHTTQKMVYSRCTSCGGLKEIQCRTCRGSGVNTCKTCRGTGTVICQRCGGNGSITCPTCNGHKELYNYYALNQTVQPRALTKCFLEPHVFENYPQFSIDPLKYTGLNRINETSDSLKEDLIDSTPFSQSYKGMLTSSLTSSPFDGKQGSTRRVRQKVLLSRMDVYDLRYRYKDKKYKLLVWGYEDELQVYAAVSPFSDLRDEFLTKAENRAIWHRWGQCFNWLDKADDLDVHNEEERIYQLKEKIEKKMYIQYLLGILAGSLLSAWGLGKFSLVYFSQDHFVRPGISAMFAGSHSLPRVHSLFMSGLFTLLLILSQKRMHSFMKTWYGNKIRHEWVRWIFPVLAACVSSAIIWTGVWAFSTSGIGLTLSIGTLWCIEKITAVVSYFQRFA